MQLGPFFVSLLVACQNNSSTVITQSWCHLVEFCFFIRQPIFDLFEIRNDNLLRNFAHEKKGFQIILACHGPECVCVMDFIMFQSAFLRILSRISCMPQKGVKLKKANLSFVLLLLQLLTQFFLLLLGLPFKSTKMGASAGAKGSFLQNFLNGRQTLRDGCGGRERKGDREARYRCLRLSKILVAL
jgi:hypothetical protein